MPLITGDVVPKLHAYMSGILKQWENKSLAIDGAEDHVHILCVLSKNHALSKILEEVKKGSSKWIKSQGPQFENFHWQRDYGAFSVSQSNVLQVKQYIANQKQHHQTILFQDELRELLKRHQIEYDDRYLWD